MEIKQDRSATTLVFLLLTGMGLLFIIIPGVIITGFIKSGVYQPDELGISGLFPFWILISCGILLLIIGLVVLAKGRKARKEQACLLSEGIHFPASVTKFYMNTALSINGRHPYIAECVYTNSYGENILVKSKNLWPEFIPQPGELEATVHVDRNNPENYYVTVSSLHSLPIDRDYR